MRSWILAAVAAAIITAPIATVTKAEESKTIIKKDDDGDRSKTVIKKKDDLDRDKKVIIKKDHD
jgi:hypothetical protein